MQQNSPLTRNEVLDRIFNMFLEEDKILIDNDLNPESDIYRQFEQDAKRRNQEMSGLVQAYCAGLPVVALSRCPFSGAVVEMAIDNQGLDGLWWNSDAPIRPDSNLPDTFFALSGAILLSETLEKSPFICAPGPQKPFVVPRLLAYQQIRAVLTSTKIGRHTAYPIVYFADPMLYGVERLNDWGSEHYGYFDESGVYRVNQAAPESDEYDYNLAEWIKCGKLLWIRPGDPALTLHSDLADCPFLDLAGDTGEQIIENGRLSRLQEDLSFNESALVDFDDPDLMILLEKINAGEE